MLKHIVMWKFLPEAEGHTAQENMDIIAGKLKALLPIIPEIKSFEIGKDALHSEMSYDMALIMEFESFEALDTYKNHPEHKKVSAYVKSVRQARTCVDFWED